MFFDIQQLLIFGIPSLGLEDTSDGKVLAGQCKAQSLIPRTHIKSRVWWVVLVLPTPGRKTGALWGSLAGKPSITSQ